MISVSIMIFAKRYIYRVVLPLFEHLTRESLPPGGLYPSSKHFGHWVDLPSLGLGSESSHFQTTVSTFAPYIEQAQFFLLGEIPGII